MKIFICYIRAYGTYIHVTINFVDMTLSTSEQPYGMTLTFNILNGSDHCTSLLILNKYWLWGINECLILFRDVMDINNS